MCGNQHQQNVVEAVEAVALVYVCVYVNEYVRYGRERKGERDGGQKEEKGKKMKK